MLRTTYRVTFEIDAEIGFAHIGWLSTGAQTDPLSASDNVSDAVLVVRGLSGADDAGLKKVNFSSAVHLRFTSLSLVICPLV